MLKRYSCPIVWAFLALCSAATTRAEYPFVFKDTGDEAGLYPHVGGIRGHGAAWGDADGDGWPELFVTAFHDAGSKPAMFFRNRQGKFELDPQEHLHTSGMGSGGLLVDLTNSGRLDLYASTCVSGNNPVRQTPSYLFRNEGNGKFTDISRASGACPPGYAGRGLAALDFDGDGLLDLITCEQYYSPDVKTGPALYRNLGNYKFENVSESAGLPVGLGGLGVAVADVNNDTLPDIFLTNGAGDLRLYVNAGKGKFREPPGTREVFRWEGLGKEDTPAGVAIGDVNRDGLADIVVGNHFKSPWVTPAPVRLYLNRGIKGGNPSFEDVSEACGISPLAMKAPHLEIQDFDHDGWPDICISIVKFQDSRPCPVIFKNLGAKKDGLPRFRDDAWGVNDFPNDEDKAIKSSGPQFQKILKEGKIMYMAAGPTADYDRDGKLDMFLANWWIESRSLLLKNETPGGNWLAVRVEGTGSVNRMGVGARINVYPAGKLGDAASRLGSHEICIGYGYCSGQEAIANIGLGKEEAVDLEVVLPHNRGKLTQENVKANQYVTVK
jgi:hypothetical protein